MIRTLPTLLLLTFVLLFAGCRNAPSSRATADSSTAQADTRNNAPAAAADNRPLAFVNGQAITWQQLEKPLYELAGGQILTEAVIDELLNRQLRQNNITITEKMIEQERQIMRELFDPDPNRAQTLINQLRERRGLGEARFAALLHRSAAMRALVQDEITVSEHAVRQAYDYEYGPRYEARLIVTERLSEASDVVARAKAGESFIDLAIQRSIDPSRSQGGLIGTISPADGTYPKAVRDALVKMEPGDVSDPIALEQGFAILRLQRKIPPRDITLERVRPQIAMRVRRDLEDLRIRQLRTTLLNEAQLVIMNPTLKESYDRWRKLQTPEE